MLSEIDLPTVLFGFVTMFSTAVAFLYKDMRKDMLRMQAQHEADQKRCEEDNRQLRDLLLETQKRIGVCVVPNCPNRTSPKPK